MRRILVTGATGNIGREVIQYLCKLNTPFEIIAAVRNTEEGKRKLSDTLNLRFRQFDFDNPSTFDSSFNDIEILFLLRPPHISDVEVYFLPLLKSAQANGIQKILFLSVQGAEKSKVIPHNKIERMIQSLGSSYIFVRPSYFMQNLTTTLLPEIIKDQTITLPSGKATFNWIDVQNISEASAILMLSFERYQNKAFEITGTENMNFLEVTGLMTAIIGRKITYRSINPISFYFKKRKEGVGSRFAVVITILHFLPRFQNEPMISENFKLLAGAEPTTIREFILRERENFILKKYRSN
ncbi:MAG: NmrA family NAD(P)-binding protein [Cyclobacteriaceae bacterium]